MERRTWHLFHPLHSCGAVTCVLWLARPRHVTTRRRHATNFDLGSMSCPMIDLAFFSEKQLVHVLLCRSGSSRDRFDPDACFGCTLSRECVGLRKRQVASYFCASILICENSTRSLALVTIFNEVGSCNMSPSRIRRLLSLFKQACVPRVYRGYLLRLLSYMVIVFARSQNMQFPYAQDPLCSREGLPLILYLVPTVVRYRDCLEVVACALLTEREPKYSGLRTGHRKFKQEQYQLPTTNSQ